MGESMSEGLLRMMLQGTPLSSLNILPQLTERELVVEITQDQLRTLLLQNVDERAKQAVTIECHEGKLTLKIRLF